MARAPILLAVVAMLSMASRAQAATPGVPEVRAAASAARAHSDGFTLDDRPESPRLLEHRWAILRNYAGAWLDTHPGADGPALAGALKAADPNLEINALRLDDASVLVGASDNEIGTAFITTRRDGRTFAAWGADQPGAESAPFPALQSWRPDHAAPSCHDQGAACRPLYPAIGALPKAADGAVQFYINATYAQGAGATVGGQLSLWRWDGHRATPLLVRVYTFMTDQSKLLEVAGSTVRLTTKGEWKTLFACGACEGRQVELTFTLAANGVRLTSQRSLTPEVDAADAFVTRMKSDKPAEDLAASAAVAGLKARFNPDDDMMVGGWRAKAEGPGRRTLWLGFDGLDCTRFDLAGEPGRLRVLGVAPANEGACSGPGAHN